MENNIATTTPSEATKALNPIQFFTGAIIDPNMYNTVE